jgi:hypothetical protein
MSEWITDRLPTEADADEHRSVFYTNEKDGTVTKVGLCDIELGDAWMPIPKRIYPAPYVKPEPQRWKPRDSEAYYAVVGSHLTNFIQAYWGDDIMHEARFKDGNVFQTKEQALEASRRLRETFLNYHKELNNE